MPHFISGVADQAAVMEHLQKPAPFILRQTSQQGDDLMLRHLIQTEFDPQNAGTEHLA
ncbi:hypothetical protein P775_26150 [Puniceibacterium antarcticum]|uniref:Uncharacterized protein n=1 Tax=Puniceibacterium antarcticum TaxID=1206336 RepID=A0A2G8R028_9RHOB|nr:hypothetical protein P775_26150 [Puniceibacterium antarcticum]